MQRCPLCRADVREVAVLPARSRGVVHPLELLGIERETLIEWHEALWTVSLSYRVSFMLGCWFRKTLGCTK
jgi:hypothetical protein